MGINCLLSMPWKNWKLFLRKSIFFPISLSNFGVKNRDSFVLMRELLLDFFASDWLPSDETDCCLLNPPCLEDALVFCLKSG